MAMIKCPECGAEISTRAVSCVKCGLPMSEIYICPECGEVMFRSGKTVCSKCGCPIEDNPYVVNTESQRKGSYTVEEDNAAGADADAQYVAIAEKIIKKAFSRNPLNSVGVYCESGNPISDERKVAAAKIAFDIPVNDKVFLIVSGNFMSGVDERMKGFAVTSHGVFFNDDHRKKGSFFLDEFVDVKISRWSGYLRFGDYEFNLGNDLNRMIRALNDLQNETMKYL